MLREDILPMGFIKNTGRGRHIRFEPTRIAQDSYWQPSMSLLSNGDPLNNLSLLVHRPQSIGYMTQLLP